MRLVTDLRFTNAFYESLAEYGRRHQFDTIRSYEEKITMRTFIAYITTNGHLVVRPYLGETELQQARQGIREIIGTFGATDLVQARATANKLRGLTK